MPKDVTKKDKKEKKENKHFFKDFKAELKRVIWPTPKQLVNNTVAVITIVLITAVIVFALDVIFKTANDYGIDKLRTVVHTHNDEAEENENVESNESDPAEENTNTEKNVENNDAGANTEKSNTEGNNTQN